MRGRVLRFSAIVLASSLIGTGSVLGLLFERVGSAELFFSGLALLLFQDLARNKRSPLLQNSRTFSLALFAFESAFIILAVVGASELFFYDLFSSFRQVLFVAGVIGVICLFVGGVPYGVWVLRGLGKKN